VFLLARKHQVTLTGEPVPFNFSGKENTILLSEYNVRCGGSKLSPAP
jgi:hypothetical protein